LDFWVQNRKVQPQLRLIFLLRAVAALVLFTAAAAALVGLMPLLVKVSLRA
jgi:hypothetical protein